MTATPSQFHYPPDIVLESSPLIEAWLELRWQLVSAGVDGLVRDTRFPFALGAFYRSVKDHFPYLEHLDASHAPDEMLPHVARHRFRPREGGWPLFQLGPGVATVNFVQPYNWDEFQRCALYLREALLEAYEGDLTTQMAALRYRNGAPFAYSSESLLDWLRSNLSTFMELPQHIPGSAGATGLPSSAKLAFTFDLVQPVGKGTIQLGTGLRRQADKATGGETKEEMVLWELEVVSTDAYAPPLASREHFVSWLAQAHAVIHEWFFSMIEGPLHLLYGEKSG